MPTGLFQDINRSKNIGLFCKCRPPAKSILKVHKCADQAVCFSVYVQGPPSDVFSTKRGMCSDEAPDESGVRGEALSS